MRGAAERHHHAGARRGARGGPRAHARAGSAVRRRAGRGRARPADEPAGVGSRPHRRLRGPLAGAPPRGPAAAAPGAGRGLRRVRDPAPGARLAAAAGPRASGRVPRGGARAGARRPRPPRRGRRRRARDGAAPRAPAHGDHAAGDRAGPARAPRRPRPRPPPGAARAPRRPRAGARRGRAVPARGPRRRLRLRQRAPAPRGRGARVRDRADAGHQRHVPALRRGRGLRAARMVERRGMVLEGGLRHHPPRGVGGRRVRVAAVAPRRLGAAAPRRAGRPRLLVRGRRLRQSARRSPPHRGGVGEGGDLGPGDAILPPLPVGRAAADPGRREPRPCRARARPRRDAAGRRRAVRSARDARRRVGVDVEPVRGLSGLRRPPLPRVLRGVLRAAATACCAAAPGPRAAAWRPRRSATGTCRSAGRSSPACGSHGTCDARAG